MERNSFGGWYKKNYHKANLDAPKDAWQNISAQLDANMSHRKRFGVFYYSLALLVVVGTALLFVNNQYLQLYSPLLRYAENITVNENIDAEFEFLTPKISEKKYIYQKNTVSKTPIEITIHKNETNPFQYSKNEFYSKQFATILLPNKIAKSIYYALPEFSLFTISTNFVEEEQTEKKQNSLSGFWAGVGYHFNQSTLVNNIFKQGLDKNSLVLLQNFQSKNFSALVGYDINKKLSIVAQAQIASSTGQKYSTYSDEGIFTTNILQFERNSISVALRTPINAAEKMIPLFASAGIYGAKISSVEIEKNQTKYSLADNYRTFDAGVLLGISTEIPLAKSISIMPQIETKIGAVNLFKGEGKIPSHFNQTHNLSLKTGVSLKISL